MPLLPGIVSITKVAKVYTTPNAQDPYTYVLAKSVSHKGDEEATPEPLLQGTPKTRIFRIGAFDETFAISAPVLIGGAAPIDIRALANKLLSNALDPTNRSLPILTSATLSISSESGASYSLNLASDGRDLVTPPSGQTAPPPVFVISARSADISAVDTYLKPTNTNSTTRVASHYDFQVNLGGFTYLVEEGTITVTIRLMKKNYVAGVIAETANNPVNWDNNFGTQFPWLAIESMQISGSGKASILINTDSADIINNSGDLNTTTSNINLIGGKITAQPPGISAIADTPFAINIWNGVTEQWDALFPEEIDVSKSILHGATEQYNTGVMTADFEFVCYVI